MPRGERGLARRRGQWPANGCMLAVRHEGCAVIHRAASVPREHVQPLPRRHICIIVSTRPCAAGRGHVCGAGARAQICRLFGNCRSTRVGDRLGTALRCLKKKDEP